MASNNPHQIQRAWGNGLGRPYGLQHTRPLSNNKKDNDNRQGCPSHRKSAAVNSKHLYGLQQSTSNTENMGKRLGVQIWPPINNAGENGGRQTTKSQPASQACLPSTKRKNLHSHRAKSSRPPCQSNHHGRCAKYTTKNHLC